MKHLQQGFTDGAFEFTDEAFYVPGSGIYGNIVASHACTWVTGISIQASG